MSRCHPIFPTGPLRPLVRPLVSRLLAGWLAVSFAGMASADEPIPWLTLEAGGSPFFTAIGSATSQGVSVLKADQARATFGVTGAGVKLGVISDSFNGSGSTPTLATQITAGNLPGTGNPNGYTTGVTVVKDDAGSDEGRAMLEIVHDVAPGAQLYFHSAFNNTQTPGYTSFETASPDQTIADAIDGLAAVQGMRIIVDDVGMLTAPRFQDGAAASSANAAFANGIGYFSAAGNSATNATRVTTSAGVNGTVNWGSDDRLLMRLSGGSTGRVVLQWGEPYTSVSGSAATSDFVVEATSPDGATSYFSVNNQWAGEDPYELLAISNGGATADFAIRVTRLSGTAPVLMQLSTFDSAISIIDSDRTNAPTIHGHAAATGAVAVAASYWGTPTSVESFSSRGPTQILFDANGNPVNELRSTPLLTAPDGGTTTTSGFASFFGTSAAAPHAAAVAALVLERFDQKGVAVSTRDLYQVLYDSAVDIGTAGFDTSSGYGRIDALAAVSAGRIWDGNGSTAGVSGTGSWSQAKWTLEEAGDKPTGKFIRGQEAIFGSGTSAQASYSVAVDGSYDVAGLKFARDTVTLASGSGALRLTAPTVEVASGLTATIAAALSGTSGLVKVGGGALRLTGSTGYSGGTTISAGTLFANGNLASSGPIVVAAAGTLAGSGTVGTVTLGANATIAPGNSPGVLTTGDVVFGAGGNYNWQLTSATGTAGSQWDFINSTGSLTVAATTGDPFAVNLWTLSGTGPDVSGPAANFNQLSNYTWKIGTFAGGITNFASNLFTLVTGSANGTDGFANAFLGTFSIAAIGNDLSVVYSAPVVQTYAYSGGAGSFSDGANWSGGVAPAGYGTIVFTGAGGTATNDLVSLVNGLAFSGSATGSYVVAGSAMSPGAGGIVNDSAFAQTIQAGLTLTTTAAIAANAGSLAVSGGLDNGGFGVTVTGTGGTTIASLAGAGGLVKNGAGTLSLTGSGSYSGGTTINAGRVVAGASAALGSGTARLVVNGGVFDTGSVDVAVGAISGSSGASITTGTLSGIRTLTTTVASGTSTFAGALVDAGAGRLALAKSGAGTLVLSGSNSATGGITVNAGSLLAGGPSALGGTATPVVLNGGSLNTGTFSLAVGALSGSAGSLVTTAMNVGTRTFTTNVASGTSLFAGTLANGGTSGVLALTKSGGGTLVLSGSSSATGTTTIAGGTLQVGNGGTTGRLGSGSIANAGTLGFNRSDGYGGAVTNLISGSGGVVLAGGTLTLAATNSYSGGTRIEGGTMLVGNTFALGGTAGPLTVSNGTLNMQTFSLSVGGLSGGTNAVITTVATAGTRTLTTNVGTGTSVYAGRIQNSGSGTLALTKTGSGALVLSGSSPYSGPTTVNAGVLKVNGAVASSAVSINASATLAGAGSVGGVTVNAGGTLMPGDGVGSLTTGNAIFGAGGSYTWQLSDATGGAGSGWDLLGGSGGLTINATTGSPFAITLATLSGTGQAAGAAANFNQYTTSTWTIASFAGGISGFSSDLFSIVTSGFANPFVGGFSVTTAGNDLNLVYTAPSLAAYDYTGGTGNFSDGANWSLGAAPAGTPSITFSGSGGTATNDLLAAVNGIAFDGSTTGGYVVDGGGLAVGSGGVSNESTFTQTIQTPLVFTTAATIDADAGDLVVASVDSGGFGVAVLGAGDTTIGSLTGGGGLSKTGVGTLLLSGSNSFTGGTTLDGGTVVAGHALALGGTANALAINAGTLDTGPVNVSVGPLTGSAGGVVTTSTTAGTRTLTTLLGSGSAVFAGTIRDAGTGVMALTKTGVGTLVLSGSNAHSGGTTIVSGTLQVGAGGTTGSLGSGAITNNGGLAFHRTDNYGGPLDTAISGSGSLRLVSGSLVLTAANTYTGVTTISAGTLQVGAGGTTGSLGTGPVTNFGAVVFNRSDAYGGPLASSISGTGSLSLTRGSLTLTGSSSFTGPTTIAGGTLQVGSGGTAGRLGSGAIVNNGAVVFSRSDAYGGAVTNAISGSGSLTVAGGSLSLAGVNTFTGATRISSGVLSLANTRALSQSTLDMNALDSGSVAFAAGGSQTYSLGGLTGSRNILIGGNSLTIGGNNRSTSYSGVLSGSGGFTKIGTGTFTMTGSNAHSGMTIVTAGRLVGTTTSLRGTINNYSTLEFAQAVDGTFGGRISNIAMGPVQTVKSGSGTLALTGTISGGSVSVNQGRLVTGGGNVVSATLVANAAVEFNQITNGTFAGWLTGSGAVAKTGSGTLTLQSGGFTGTTTVSAGRLVASASTLRGPIATSAAFDFAQSANGEYASVLSGSGTLTKSGSGTLTLSGSSLVTGLTTVSGGMLATGGAERLADVSTVSISPGATLRLGGNETIGGLIGSGSVNLQSFRLTVAGSGSSSYFGNIGGSGGLTKAGSGLLSLAGTNGFLGATNLNTGTLVLSSSSALSPFTTLSIAAGSTLVVNRDVRVFAYTNAGGTITGTGRLLTSATAATGGTLTALADVSGTDSYSVGLLKTSTATLVVSGSTSFTGGVVVEQGTVKLETGGSFDASNVVDVRSGATLDLGGNSQTVAALAGSGSVALGGGTLTVAAATNTTFSGAIEGGALVKSGASALNLTGSAAVSTASVSSGLMSVNGTLNGTVAVAPGGTLGGAGTIIGDVTVGGTHAPGNSPEISTIEGNLSYTTGATVVWEIAANTATQGAPGSRVFDQIVVGGNLAFSGSTALVLSFFDQDPDTTWASTVDWTDDFWNSGRSWTLWQVSGTTTGFSNLTLQTQSWLDSTGAAFGTVLPDRTFSLSLAGNDVTLVYAVPEPSAILLAAAGMALGGLAIRRPRRKGLRAGLRAGRGGHSFRSRSSPAPAARREISNVSDRHPPSRG